MPYTMPSNYGTFKNDIIEYLATTGKSSTFEVGRSSIFLDQYLNWYSFLLFK